MCVYINLYIYYKNICIYVYKYILIIKIIIKKPKKMEKYKIKQNKFHKRKIYLKTYK